MDGVIRTSEMRPVVHSQWGYRDTAYGCMNCGYGVSVPIYNYCPNCGAKMSEDVVGKRAPDMTNVVRCGKYKFWKACSNGEPNFGKCDNIGGLWWDYEFCSDGDRRDAAQ